MATFLKSLRNLRHSHACVSIARSASLLATARQTAASTAKTSSLKRIAALSTTTAPRGPCTSIYIYTHTHTCARTRACVCVYGPPCHQQPFVHCAHCNPTHTCFLSSSICTAGGDAGKGNTNAGSKSRRLTKGTATLLPDDVPGLAEFMRSSTVGEASGVVDAGESAELPPYLSPIMLSGEGKQV